MTDETNSENLTGSSVDWATVYRWVLGTAVVVTLLKGFRLPNLFAATHFVLNYSLGFVRRGLVGEVVRRVFGSWAFTYNLFVGFAFTVLVCAAFGLAVSLRRVLVLQPKDVLYRLALLVFVSSPALVFFVHMVGYLDYIGLVAVLAVLAWAPGSHSTWRIFLAVGLCGVVFAFIHEILAVMFMPPLCFLMACHVVRIWTDVSIPRRVMMVTAGAAAVAVAFGLSATVGTLGTQSPEVAYRLQAKLATKTDFGLRPDVFSALSRSSAENLAVLMPWYWRSHPAAQLAPKAWLASLPSLLFLVRYGTGLVSRLPVASWGRWMLGLMLVGSVVAPQLLNFVGWDWSRWLSISLLGCFICITAAKLFFPSVQYAASTGLLCSGALALLLSLAATTPLFDEFFVQFFPFDEQVKFILQWFEPGFRYRPVL